MEIIEHKFYGYRIKQNPSNDKLALYMGGIDAQVLRDVVSVDNAVGWVLAAVGKLPTVGPLTDELEAAARDAAAWRAAADIELAYPERTANVNVARDLDARANSALAALREALATESGGPVALLPVWQAPPPPTWADNPLL